jgi:hypothetical protein
MPDGDPASLRCLAEGCQRASHRRGLCPAHYDLARRRVRRGETTWEQLEQSGQCLPARPRRLPWRDERTPPEGRQTP